MKTLTRLLIVAALASLFALPSLAQDAAAPANPCESAERTELYTKYYEQKKAQDQAPAFATAKEYLAKYETACPDQYSKAVRKFHDAYAAATGKATLQKAFYDAVNAKDARKAIDAGKQLLAIEPDNSGIHLLTAFTAYNGLVTKGSPVYNDAGVTSETVAAANRAIEMIQAGKEPKDVAGKTSWAPFKGRDDALAWANFWSGTLQFRNAPDAAVKQLVTVAQSNVAEVKENPTVYTVLAVALETERARLAEEYKKFSEENDQTRLLLANINQIVDRQIDAYARAVAYEKDAARKAEWMTTLTELYKSRNEGKTDGLQAKIDAIKTTPLLVTTPITTPPPAPTPAPTPTPAPGNGQPAAAARKP